MKKLTFEIRSPAHQQNAIHAVQQILPDPTKPLWPSVGTIICYCASFWLLAQTLAYIPTGIAYAIWSGVGIVLISLLSWGFFGQRLDLPAIIGMMLICAGVLVINLLSRSTPH
ncbi:small multidrug resistance (SMR) efflux transporter [Escherichia phage D2]|nr:small multidrug resistance (SMR) efflux transporter [Escherichia phage D2]